MVLRIKRPDAHRPFKVPVGPIIPVLGVAVLLYLMVSLSVMTWVRFLVWLDLGMIIYWFYGRTHSPLVNRAEATRPHGVEELGELPEDARLHAALQRLLHHAARAPHRMGRDERGAGEVERARRVAQHASGMHINPEIADAFGLKILARGHRRGGHRARARTDVEESVVSR